MKIFQDPPSIKEEDSNYLSEICHNILQVTQAQTETRQSPPFQKVSITFSNQKNGLEIHTVTKWCAGMPYWFQTTLYTYLLVKFTKISKTQLTLYIFILFFKGKNTIPRDISLKCTVLFFVMCWFLNELCPPYFPELFIAFGWNFYLFKSYLLCLYVPGNYLCRKY